jgi:SAM-dependent methyltransferase
VVDLLHPDSVLDVGCGLGDWMAAFRVAGVSEVLGLEGAWVEGRTLAVEPERVLVRDLSRPLDLEDRFDLVVSLEVAEHLPPAAAPVFVDTLTVHGDAVLFSAAAPRQGGTHHLNEQWPAYWTHLFGERGFESIDCVRWRFWDDLRVASYYAQNMFLAVREGSRDDLATIRALAPPGPVGAVCSVIHPRAWIRRSRPPEVAYSSRQLAGQCVRRMRSAVGMRWRRLIKRPPG